MGLWLFRAHLAGEGTFIGDSDRLNAFLNVLVHETGSLHHGRLPAWNDSMFMGFNVYSLHYTFPNPLTYMTYLAVSYWPSELFWIAGVVSCGLLILAGWVAYAFIKDTCADAFCAFVGAALYEFSALSVLRISQNDMSVAVLILLPLILLFLRRSGRTSPAKCLLALSALLASLLYFTFLQEAAYGLILCGVYALYRTLWMRRWRPALVFAAACAAAITVAMPRLYTVGRDFGMVERVAPGYDPKQFEEAYKLVGTRPREFLRWLDDGIFGRFPGEAAALGNGVNLHEGLLLYTSTFAALLVLWGLIRFWGEWLRLPRFKDEDAPFHLWFLAVVFLVVLAKPSWHVLYVLFMKVDFTHARIVVAGLLPFCTLVAILLRDLRGSTGPEGWTRGHARMLGLGAMGAVAILLAMNGAAHRVGELARVPLDGPPSDLGWANLQLLIFGTAPGVPTAPATVITERTWLRAGALLQIEYAAIVFALLVLGMWVSRRREPVRWALGYCLGFLMVFQGIAYADFQINGPHTRGEVPFRSNNLLTAKSDEFRVPSAQARSSLRHRLETDRYRTVVICDPTEFPAFCAPHLSQFWELRLVDGYMSGIPSRLVRLPWPDGAVSPRAISFASGDALPWPTLSFLNVKYAVEVNGAFYKNRVAEGDGARRDATPSDVKILENPLPVAPRQFFAAAVEPVDGPEGAARRLFPAGSSGAPPLDVRRQSVVEGFPSARRFSVEGSLVARYDGDEVEVTVDPATEARFLVLNELYHPGWRAYAGETELRVYPTNVVMRGVVVPPGASQITLRFVPFFRSETALLFLAAGGCLLLGSWWGLRHLARGPRGGGSDGR